MQTRKSANRTSLSRAATVFGTKAAQISAALFKSFGENYVTNLEKLPLKTTESEDYCLDEF